MQGPETDPPRAEARRPTQRPRTCRSLEGNQRRRRRDAAKRQRNVHDGRRYREREQSPPMPSVQVQGRRHQAIVRWRPRCGEPRGSHRRGQAERGHATPSTVQHPRPRRRQHERSHERHRGACGQGRCVRKRRRREEERKDDQPDAKGEIGGLQRRRGHRCKVESRARRPRGDHAQGDARRQERHVGMSLCKNFRHKAMWWLAVAKIGVFLSAHVASEFTLVATVGPCPTGPVVGVRVLVYASVVSTHRATCGRVPSPSSCWCRS